MSYVLSLNEMLEARLEFLKPTLAGVFLHRDGYPEELRVCLEVKYGESRLKFGGFSPLYKGDLRFLSVEGVMEFTDPESSGKVKVLVDKMLLLDQSASALQLCSKPLRLEHIHRIADNVKGDRISISWSIKGYAYALPQDLYRALEDLRKSLEFLPESLVIVSMKGAGEVYREVFVKHIVAEADLVERLFLELQVKPASEELVNRIREPEIRDALRILSEKWEIFLEALKEYRRAVTTSDYRDVIGGFRRAIEGLTAEDDKLGKKVFSAARRALESLGVVEEITPGSGARERETKNILESLDQLSKAVYSLASTLGVHERDYRSSPSREDAELVMHGAALLLNYLTKALTRYAVRS